MASAGCAKKPRYLSTPQSLKANKPELICLDVQRERRAKRAAIGSVLVSFGVR